MLFRSKRGRMPGCGLILCTQQPAATDARILSQLDLLITHTLTFADDIAALRARVPTSLPKEIGDTSFIRRIPVGDAIIADHSMATERAFVAAIRPRTSEHAGRAVTPELEQIEKQKPPKPSEKPEPLIFHKERKTIAKGVVIASPVVRMPVIKKVRKERVIPVPVLNIEEDLLKKYQINTIKQMFQEQFKGEQNNLYGQSFIRKDPESFLAGFIDILKSEGWSVDKIQSEGDIPVIFVSKGTIQLAFTLAIQKLLFSWFAGTEKKEGLMDFGNFMRKLIQKAEEAEEKD